MDHPIIAVIGAGNMGGCLIGGLIKEGYPAEKLWAADPSFEKLALLQQHYPIHITTENTKALQTAEVVILATKPQTVMTILAELKNHLTNKPPFILSIAAGVTIDRIEQALGKPCAIVRAMPNTAALIGCGATALYANQATTESQHEWAETILRSLGTTVWLQNESLMNTVTALSGSGPAYFFLVMEALEKAAEELGLAQDIAQTLTLQTALGATRMALESGKSLAELRQNVTSAGGTTEAALSVLEKNNLRDLFKKALEAAKMRSEELAHS